MERRAITIQGTVQGVGFRPFVHTLANRLRLGGFVKNQAGVVRIEVEGEAGTLDRFLEEIVAAPPPLARIDDLQWLPRPVRGERQFHIEPSDDGGQGPIVIAPDTATCDACLAELFDPTDRRHRYPFINCTRCGPRLSIVTGAPYDRPRTTMAGFPMCDACRAEYESPDNRRFHAQPIACPRCGPRLTLCDDRGSPMDTDDPLASFIQKILVGGIGAMKGLGGYHLICAAGNDEAVKELRRRKHREEKPFAVMVTDVEAARRLCEVSAAEAALLTSSRRPIVLLHRHDADDVIRQFFSPPLKGGARGGIVFTPLAEEPSPGPSLKGRGIRALARHGNGLADGVAPGNPFVGIMLPYTPLHHLLMRDMDGVPLVMTSGNRSDEPIAYTEPEVFERLRGIADVFLTHDRPIHVRCDDSVTRVIGVEESPVRRSRGYAPQPITLPFACPVPILAVGGQLKATFALGSERRAILSQHMGDLDHLEAFNAFERDVALYEQLFSIRPAVIVHDMHPDYASTRYAVGCARSLMIPGVAGTESSTDLSSHLGNATSSSAQRADIHQPRAKPWEIDPPTVSSPEGALPSPQSIAPSGLQDSAVTKPGALPRAGECQPLGLKNTASQNVGKHEPPMPRHRSSIEPGLRGLSPSHPPKLIPVQHHHAHMASCMAEHGMDGPVIGVIFDGTGYGTDGTIWGGEFLIGDYRGFKRAAHFRGVGLPGGEAAVREPWRMAVSHLRDAGAACRRLESRLIPGALRAVRSMIERGFNTPITSSAGRLFDAVAALAGVRDAVSYEGQAAMELEWLATGEDSDKTYPVELINESDRDGPIVVDTRPMIRAIAADVDNGIRDSLIARAFHRTIAVAILRVCERLRATSKVDVVALSGGVFMNALLASETGKRLGERGFRVLQHHLVPPNDGGISLGQLAIAAARCNQREED